MPLSGLLGLPPTKAEELAAHAEGLIEQGDLDGLAPVWAALAQVHATLANAAASALGEGTLEAGRWRDVAGLKFTGR